MSLTGERDAACALVHRALPALARHPIYDLGCHEVSARVLRRARDLKGAGEQLEIGLRRAEPFHEHRGRLLHEQSRLTSTRADAPAEREAREAGNAAFRLAGLEVRVATAPLREHGSAVDEPGERGQTRAV